MRLQLRFIFYFVALHLPFAGIAMYALADHRMWLFVVEVAFAVSLVVGYRLVRSLFGTLELIGTGTQFFDEGDFTVRFTPTGLPEMDNLISMYNRMTDRLREERVRLVEQDSFLEKITTASPSGVVTLDFDGRISMANPAARRMLSLSNEELLGKRPSEPDSPLVQALVELAVGESRVVPIAGRRRLKCRRSQFLDRGFERHFFLIEELTEELRQSEKAAYERMIRLMSHEVNNTVGASNSLLHSCLHYAGHIPDEDRADFEEALRIVISRTSQLSAFMRSFSDVARLPQPNRQSSDPARMLRDIAALLRASEAAREIEWKWEIAEPVPVVSLDQVQMEQVFINILKNAVEAINGRGTVTIRVGTDHGRPFVIVEDSGEGFTGEVREQLFTPFFSTKENGQGIGLTLIQEILDRHGFEFSLDGGDGRPTRFTIWFAPGLP